MQPQFFFEVPQNSQIFSCSLGSSIKKGFLRNKRPNCVLYLFSVELPFVGDGYYIFITNIKIFKTLSPLDY